jgi:cephalosporin hydroxylase
MNHIEKKYLSLASIKSDINEHLPTLYGYAKECETVLELGVRGCVSSYAFALGLLHNNKKTKFLMMNDLTECDIAQLKHYAKNTDLDIKYKWVNDLELDTPLFDLTFIDTYHVYGQLIRELEKFAPLTNKYIIMHDTEVDKVHGECIRNGWDPERMARITNFAAGEHKLGLQFAIDEFLERNNNWKIKEIFTNNNGLTILKRR